MSTLVAYSTRHGATRNYAENLAKRLPGEVTLIDLRKEPNPGLSGFETVVIGSAIYAGQVQKEVKEFCERNIVTLKEKRLGLFICCWHEGEEARKQLQTAYPAEILSVAAAKEAFGGDMNLTHMNLFERLAVKVIVKVSESATHYSDVAVQQFCKALQAS
jgi:menaquinone-dependent protoporphyrinogen oxidase